MLATTTIVKILVKFLVPNVFDSFCVVPFDRPVAGVL
jgi:hypothetical protein